MVHSSAQSIERQVIATSGDYFEANTIQLSQTIGEPIIESSLGGNNHLTQGFQQGEFMQIILPIELLLFDAKRKNKKEVRVDWEIAKSEQIQHFIVQRKWKEKTFVAIQTIVNEEELNFTFLDQNDAVKETYYRLKIVNWDGSFSFSTIKAVDGIPTNQFASIFPNPITAESIIAIEQDARSTFETMTIAVFNQNGQMLFNNSYAIDNPKIKLNKLQELPQGNYLLQLQFNQEHTEVIAFSKI